MRTVECIGRLNLDDNRIINEKIRPKEAYTRPSEEHIQWRLSPITDAALIEGDREAFLYTDSRKPRPSSLYTAKNEPMISFVVCRLRRGTALEPGGFVLIRVYPW